MLPSVCTLTGTTVPILESGRVDTGRSWAYIRLRETGTVSWLPPHAAPPRQGNDGTGFFILLTRWPDLIVNVTVPRMSIHKTLCRDLDNNVGNPTKGRQGRAVVMGQWCN